MSGRTGERGVTLLEMVISSAILMGIFGLLAGVVQGGAAEVRATVIAADADATLRRAVAEIAREVADSGRDGAGADRVTSHPRAAATTAGAITFQKRVALTGDAADWSAPIAYELEGDRLVRRDASGKVILAAGMSGLTFGRVAESDAITIFVEVSGTAAARTRVALRNR